jgi:amino acid adenylation domain-containing protein
LELYFLYSRLKSNPNFHPGTLKNTYKEYVIDQITLRKDRKLSDYWQKELFDFKRLEIFEKTPDQNTSGSIKSDILPIPPEYYDQLKKVSRKTGTNLKTLCFAAYVYMFAMYSYENDIVVGLVTDNRPLCEDGEKILGCFLNSVPVRIKIPEHITWRDYISLVDEKLKELKKYDRLPLTEITKSIEGYSPGQNPVFDTLFGYLDFFLLRAEDRQEIEEREKDYPGSGLAVKGYSATNTFFDFAIDATYHVLMMSISHDSSVISDEKVQKCCGYYKRVLRQFIEHSDRTAKKEAILSTEEKQELLYNFNNTQDNDFKIKLIPEMFEEQAEKTPHAVAVILADRQLTYRELNEKSNQLAVELIKRGIKTDCIVALMLEPSLEMIIGIIGILKAGGAYLPIDMQSPESRVIYMMDDSHSSVLLTGEGVLKKHAYTELAGFSLTRVDPFKTKARQPADFNGFSIYDRSVIDYEKYNRYIGQAMVRNTIALQPTRGCPYRCTFCHRVWPRKHSFRNAENLYAEIELYYKMGVRRFELIDDVFNFNVENSTRFFKLIKKNKLKLNLFFPNGLRGDILTTDYIDLMVDAGTVNIDLALETASPRLQKLIKKNLDLDKLHNNLTYLTGQYPQVILELNMMIGFPTETEEEALMTLDFVKSVKWIHFPFPFILKIHPGTKIAELALKSGIPADAIARSMRYSYQDLPETLPFSRSFAREYKAKFLSEYFVLKERILHVLPYQMKVADEDELVQRYNNYLPVKISKFSDILDLAGISMSELGDAKFLPDNYLSVPDLNKKIRNHFPRKTPGKDALRVLLLDISELFSFEAREVLHGEITEPLGLLSLLTQLNKTIKNRAHGKIAKSRIDFDNYRELESLIKTFKPDLIGIRTLSIYKDFFHRTVSFIRNLGLQVLIIGGGPYATMDYRIMLQDPGVDLAVIGEGEVTFAELVDLIITNGKKLPAEDRLSRIPGIAFIKAEDKPLLIRFSRDIIVMDRLEETLARHSVENCDKIAAPRDLVYTVYTSGSTGEPKGVLLEHRNAANLLHYQFKHTNIDFSKILQFHNIGFDVAFQEIFSALLSGGTINLIDKETRTDVKRLFEVIEKHNIKSLFLSMSFLRMIFAEEELVHLMPRCVSHIQVAGEQVVINKKIRKYLRKNNVYLHNHYGPAETHVVTTFTIDPRNEIPHLPPIGKPVSNTAVYIVDKNRQLLAAGAVGELCIAGAQVGRGYSGRKDLTAEKFVESEGTRLYTTGDLARWQPDGNLEFMGRIDFQLKIRGFRVEPEEIEHQLLNIPFVKEAVVVGKETKVGDKYLCAYVVSDIKFEESRLKKELEKRLPGYMIPSYLMPLGKIPLTANGKVDRNALPDPKERSAGDIEYHPPGTDIEKTLADMWQNILEIQNPGINADFFDIGGNSLKLSQLFIRINAHYRQQQNVVTVQDLFDNRTIKACAALIGEKIIPVKTDPKKIERIDF